MCDDVSSSLLVKLPLPGGGDGGGGRGRSALRGQNLSIATITLLYEQCTFCTFCHSFASIAKSEWHQRPTCIAIIALFASTVNNITLHSD